MFCGIFLFLEDSNDTSRMYYVVNMEQESDSAIGDYGYAAFSYLLILTNTHCYAIMQLVYDVLGNIKHIDL